jgi:hypothetical protein
MTEENRNRITLGSGNLSLHNHKKPTSLQEAQPYLEYPHNAHGPEASIFATAKKNETLPGSTIISPTVGETLPSIAQSSRLSNEASPAHKLSKNSPILTAEVHENFHKPLREIKPKFPGPAGLLPNLVCKIE